MYNRSCTNKQREKPMREVTKQYQVYTFDELESDVQDKVIEKNYDFNVDYNWWDCTYEDAANIGFKINEFDDYNLKSEFIENAVICAEKIIKEHGIACDTHNTAKLFLDENAIIQAQIDLLMSNYDNLEQIDLDKLDTLDDDINILADEFLKSLCEDYRIILRNEAEYLMSREAIIDSILANDMEFLADGTPFYN